MSDPRRLDSLSATLRKPLPGVADLRERRANFRYSLFRLETLQVCSGSGEEQACQPDGTYLLAPVGLASVGRAVPVPAGAGAGAAPSVRRVRFPSASATIRELRGHDFNVYRAVANHPEVLAGIVAFGIPAYFQNTFTPAQRELAYLGTSVANNCHY